MRFRKPSPRMVALFDDLVRGRPLRRHPMFGMPCAFAGTQMCLGLFAESLFVRLPEGDRQALAAEGGRPFEPVPGRAMREYVVVPEAMLDDRAALDRWLDRSQAYAASLPPKAPRKAARARSAAATKGTTGKPRKAGGPRRRAAARPARTRRR